MKNFVGTLKENNFLKNKMLRRIFILSVLLTLGMPLSYLFFIHPSFEKLIIMDKEEDALSIARHLSSLVPIKSNKLTRSNVPADLLNEIVKHNDHFGLIRINIYSDTGEMIFSTDKSYIDYVNNKYFIQESLTKGSVYTKFVAKDDMITGGKILPFDMIETYVPLTNGNIIIGVFEINYDITERIAQLHNLALRSCIALYSFAFTFLIIITVVLIKEHRSIIKRRQAEDALESQLQFSQQLIDSIPSPIYYKDVQGKYLGCNSAFEKFLGLSSDEIIGKTVYDLAHSEAWAEIYHETDLALFQKKGTQIYEPSIMVADGSMHDVMVHKATYNDTSGAVAGLVGVMADITKLKQTEEALRASENKLHVLSSHLLTVRERELRLISLELHDELGQSLTLLKLQLRSIKRQLRKDQEELRKEADSIVTYIDQVIENVRRLSRDLSPAILEDLGLSASLRAMVEDFSAHSGIRVSLDMEELDHLFSFESQINIYRIFQESLTNTGKHAEPQQVSLAINIAENEVALIVEDDGKGFETNEVEAKYSIEKGLGLVAIHERARMLGGSFEISSQIGKGTRLTVIIPLENSGGVSIEPLSYSTG